MVVTRDQVRKIVTGKVEALRASFQAYPLLVEYDNVITVNRSTQTLPFLAVDLVYMDGYQTALGVGNNHIYNKSTAKNGKVWVLRFTVITLSYSTSRG